MFTFPNSLPAVSVKSKLAATTAHRGLLIACSLAYTSGCSSKLTPDEGCHTAECKTESADTTIGGSGGSQSSSSDPATGGAAETTPNNTAGTISGNGGSVAGGAAAGASTGALDSSEVNLNADNEGSAGAGSNNEGSAGAGSNNTGSGGAGSNNTGSGGDGELTSETDPIDSPDNACGTACANAVSGTCAEPVVRITELDLGVTVTTNESETELRPLALGAMPGGGTRLSFMGQGDEVFVAHLSCDDSLQGSPFSFPAHDYQDIAADETGGVVMLTRAARGGGTLNCGEPANLCDGGPEPAVPCFEMWMARFDCAGNEVWAAPLTTSSETLPPYSTGPTGETSLMIWWYQHQGRLAFDGENYAAYFGVAISISENECINIHQGDRMVAVDPAGNVLDHANDFGDWGIGCSHSWNTRIVWDERADRFVMVCGTDNEGRVAMPNPYRTIYNPEDLASMSVGGLVISQDEGYWVTVNDAGTVHLLHFADGSADQDIEIASSDSSHLVPYGANNMLVAWSAGEQMLAKVLSRATGEALGPEFAIAVPDNRYQAFEAMADGSVAFAAAGTSDTSVRVARVLPCE